MARYGGGAFSISMNTEGFRKALKRFEDSIETKHKTMLVKFAVRMNDKLLANTPVWEGTTIRNWQWSLGSPQRTVKPAEGQGIDPGHTNAMALGTEPRRAVNEGAQKADFMVFLSQLASAPAGKLPNIYLTNPAPNALAVEYGELPTPERARTPRGGILRLAMAETLTAMGAR